MGEFEDEELGRKDAADESQDAADGPRDPAIDGHDSTVESPTDASAVESPKWRVRARRELTEQYVLEEV